MVKILVGRDGRPGGTGYLIRPNLVLTARHVVGKLGSKARVLYDLKVSPSLQSQTAKPKFKLVNVGAKVDWRGPGQCDIALLRLDSAVEMAVQPPLLTEDGLDVETQFVSQGWAKSAPARKAVHDSLADLPGEVCRFEPHRERFSLISKNLKKEITGWSGISGAPVFEVGGRGRLLGVVVDGDETSLNELFACPIAKALAEEDFKEKLGLASAAEQEVQLANAIQGALAVASQEALEAISRSNPKWRTAKASDSEGLATKILETAEWDSALDDLNRAHSEVCRAAQLKGSAPDEVAKIAFLLAPYLVLTQLQPLTSSSGPSFPAPWKTLTFVELAAAAYDGGPCKLRDQGERKHPVGQARLPLPTEQGFDFRGADAIEAYGAFLQETFLSQEEVDEVVEIEKRLGRTQALKRLYKFADGDLGFRAKPENEGRRRYLSYPDEFARVHEHFLQWMEDKLDSVRLFHQVGGDLDRELKMLRPLETIFRRSLERRGNA